MKRLIVVAAVLLFVSVPVVAKLCGKCRRRAYTTDVGKCGTCGGQTSSGAFKLCGVCSRKLGKCEHCRAALAGGKRAPKGTREKAAAQRARALKRRLRDFDLHLKYYGETRKPFYNLRLSVPASKSTAAGFRLTVRVDKSQASRIVDHLVASGYFVRAEYVDPRSRRETGRAPRGPRYLLTVSNENMFFREDLGWKLPMLTRLDALRKVLKGDAAVKMDLLLGRLSGLRKTWTEAQKKRPK